MEDTFVECVWNSACTIANNGAYSSGSFYPIEWCTGAFGGGLYTASGSVSITNSTFSGNGLTSVVTSSLRCMSGVTIQSAYSTNRPGGAIFTAGDLLLQRVYCLNCGSVTNGGAIFS